MQKTLRTPEEIKKGLETCIGKCTGNKPHCPYHECGDGCMDTMNRDTLALIQQLEAKAPKWISVEEGLPKEWQYVFAISQYDEDSFEPCVAYHVRGKWNTGSGYNRTVTHWMFAPKWPL